MTQKTGWREKNAARCKRKKINNPEKSAVPTNTNMAPNPLRNTLIGHLAEEDQEFQQQDIINDNDDAEEGQSNKVDEVKRKQKRNREKQKIPTLI